MPTPAILSDKLVLYQGLSCSRTLTLTAGGVAVNLTGYTVVSASLYAGSIESPGGRVQEISLANTLLTVPTPANGIILMAITPAVSALIAAGDYVQWVKYGNAGGTVVESPFIRWVSVRPFPA